MQQEQPMYTAPAKSSNTMLIVSIILGLALVGAVIWGFMQSSALKKTQAELAALQADHAALTTERDGLSSDLASTTSDLEATKAELASTKSTLEATAAELETTKGDLAKAQETNTALQAKIDAASKIVDVLTGFWTDSFDTMGDKIQETGNSDMENAFDTFLKGTDFFNDLATFQSVIFDSLAEVLE